MNQPLLLYQCFSYIPDTINTNGWIAKDNSAHLFVVQTFKAITGFPEQIKYHNFSTRKMVGHLLSQRGFGKA